MDQLFVQTLHNMQETLRAMESRVPRPVQVPYKTGFVYRYAERSIHQALIQKLARVISGLRAARLLLEAGFVQEQGALHRMLDEFQEDITFLSHAVIKNDITTLHEEYLAAFYEEEFDADTAFDSTQKRPMIPRKKIRAYIARIEESGRDPSTVAEQTRTISKAYSGFVHGASPHIMDMYGGNPPHFFVEGMRGTPRIEEHKHDLWNYFYRGIIAFGMAAKAFGDKKLDDSIKDHLLQFEEAASQYYASWQT